MTAIASVYTNAGFVIAADGRQTWARERDRHNARIRNAESDREQKIFKAKNADMEFGYTVCGDVANLTRSFDTSFELRRHVKAFRKSHFTTSAGYIEVICAHMAETVRRKVRSGALEQYPKFGIDFFGYVKGKPCIVHVESCQWGENFQLRVTPKPEFWPGTVARAGGMEDILDWISRGDIRLRDYTKPLSENPSMEEAAKFCKGYIEACSSPLAKETYPEIYGTIGGHIHIASVTPDKGFRWLIRPKSSYFVRLGK